MQIPVNKNIDEYKDDFYKGLTLRQTAFSVATVVAGTAAFMLFYTVLHVSQTIALYLALPAAFPFAVAGFLKVDNLDPIHYFKLKRRLKQQPLYCFQPCYLSMEAQENVAPENKKKKAKQTGA